jgi:hypothetical protein
MLFAAGCASLSSGPSERWSAEQANTWYAGMPWLVGCNFTPSTAINPLEMWQLDTWDPETIDRELAWAQKLGFNSVRVYLHHLLWKQHARGFSSGWRSFLDIADRHQIGVVFVLSTAAGTRIHRSGRSRSRSRTFIIPAGSRVPAWRSSATRRGTMN